MLAPRLAGSDHMIFPVNTSLPMLVNLYHTLDQTASYV